MSKEKAYMIMALDEYIIGYAIAKTANKAKVIGLEHDPRSPKNDYTDMRAYRCKELDNGSACGLEGYFGEGSFFDVCNEDIANSLMGYDLCEKDLITGEYLFFAKPRIRL